VTWFRVDDRLHSHRKARVAGVEAMGLWLLAGTWCARNETDGFIPTEVVTGWDKTQRLARRLVDCGNGGPGLWTPDKQHGETGYQFHQWMEHQPLRADLEAAREVQGVSGQRGNHLRWHVRRGVVNPGCVWCQKAIA